MLRVPVLSLLALCLVTPAVHAGFVGVEMGVAYKYPDLGTDYSKASFDHDTFTVPVGGGLVTTGLVEGFTTLPVYFTDTRLTIVLNTTLDNPTWDPVSFEGPVFTSSGSLGIASAKVDVGGTTLGGFDDSRVTFNNNQIMINWAGLSYHNGEQVVVDFTFGSAVPEPSSIVALGAGCVLPLIVAIRRRRAA
jgi:hypothetical protein